MHKNILIILITLCQGLWAYTYDIAIGAIFQNEARFLKEWIDYHRVLGVKHFWLYDNYSTDNFRQVLEPYLLEGIVELQTWPPGGDEPLVDFPYNAQRTAYDDALQRSRGKAQWLALIDLDEFLLPIKEESIIEVLNKYDSQCGAITLFWHMFGTSSIGEIPPNFLMIELLTHCAPLDFYSNNIYKSIVRPDRTLRCRSPHECDLKTYSRRYACPREIMRINHYWCRDEKHFYEVKCPRYHKFQEQQPQWYPYGGLDAWLEYHHQMMNQGPEDFIIFRFLDKLKRWQSKSR